jgi:hypothetical protein
MLANVPYHISKPQHHGPIFFPNASAQQGTAKQSGPAVIIICSNSDTLIAVRVVNQYINVVHKVH